MIRRPPRATRTDTLFPYTTLFRSAGTHCPIRSIDLVVGNRPASTPMGPGAKPRDDSGECGNVQALLETRDFSRSEEHTSELQSLMRISYAVFCLKKKKNTKTKPKVLNPNSIDISISSNNTLY